MGQDEIDLALVGRPDPSELRRHIAWLFAEMDPEFFPFPRISDPRENEAVAQIEARGIEIAGPMGQKEGLAALAQLLGGVSFVIADHEINGDAPEGRKKLIQMRKVPFGGVFVDHVAGENHGLGFLALEGVAQIGAHIGQGMIVEIPQLADLERKGSGQFGGKVVPMADAQLIGGSQPPKNQKAGDGQKEETQEQNQDFKKPHGKKDEGTQEGSDHLLRLQEIAPLPFRGGIDKRLALVIGKIVEIVKAREIAHRQSLGVASP